MKKGYPTLLCFAFVMQIASAQNTWTQKANFGGIGRMGAVAFSVGSKGYIGTGGDFGANYYNDFWEYDPSADTWTQKANFPGTSRYRALGFSTATRGYIGTGYTGGSGTISVYEYDPSSNTWTQKANMGTLNRFGAVCFTIGTKVYAGTGTTSGGYALDFWEYNTLTDVWTQKANFGGAAKIYATGFSIGPNGYLGTGAEYSNIGIGTNDFWEYDTTANSWTQKANFGGNGRSEAVGFSIGDYGYIGTGTNNWGVSALSDYWRYDPSTDTWTVVAAYPDGNVEEATGFVVGCKAYVGTGFVNDYSNTNKTSFYEYTPENDCFSLLPSAGLLVSDSEFCEITCIDFTDLSAGSPTSWQWSFPGGTPSSSTDQNPTNICYYTAGVYDVTLIATNNSGSDTIVMTNFITVNSTPTASITQSNDTLYSSPGNSYQWYTGGNAIGGATNSFYLPPSEDYYSVVITNLNGCSASDTIFYSLSSQSNFSAADTTICQKFCLDFSDQSGNNPTSWQWQFQGGAPSSSTAQNPTQICYNTPGSYSVTLITTNAFGSDTLTLQNYITVYATPPFPTITQAGYTLTSSVAVSYKWQLNSVDIPGATNQSYTVLQSGYYTVVVTDSNGCENSFTVYILIDGINNASGDANISITPNPSSGIFIIEWLNSFNAGEVSIDVVNTLGQKVFSSSEKINGIDWKKEIDLGDVARGVYFIEIKTGTEFACPDFFGVRKKIVIAK